jgi:hypothetical protein
MIKTILYFVVLMMLFSCGKTNKPPSSLIQPKDMQSILWDLMRAETLATEIRRQDTSVDAAIETKSLSQKVFSIHKTDSASFNKSYNWYVKHPDVLKIIFDSLYIQKERENNLHLKKKEIAEPLEK